MNDVINNFTVINRADKLWSHVDFVMVLSYTDHPTDVQDQCRKLSRKSKACVVYVCDTSFGDNSAVFLGEDEIPTSSISEKNEQLIKMCSIELCSNMERKAITF